MREHLETYRDRAVSEELLGEIRTVVSRIRLERICLMEVCGLEAKDVMLHRDLVATACPGRFFPAEEFRADLLHERAPAR